MKWPTGYTVDRGWRKSFGEREQENQFELWDKNACVIQFSLLNLDLDKVIKVCNLGNG